jgi:hypothetical protein
MVPFVLRLTLATCLLGIAMDMVTAHVAVEYFTVHHPHVVNSNSPIVMALVWGIGASWWFGAIAGVILWIYNRRRPVPLPATKILGAAYKVLAVLWVVLMVILLVVYSAAGLVPGEHRGASFEHDRRLVAVAVTHSTEYILGATAVVGLLIWVNRATRSARFGT